MRFPKIALAAVAVALIATMVVAEPHPTTAVSNPEKKQTHPAVSPPHAPGAPPKKKSTHATTTKAKKTTTKAKKPTKTTKPKKPTKPTTKVKPAKTTTKPVKPTKTTTNTKPTPTKPAKLGQTGVVLSQKDFCLWLPPVYGGDIAANEDRAVAFCTRANMPGAPNAGVLPAGFVKSANFVTNVQKGWVQITGRIDRSKYGLSPKDGGGQYDVRAPVGAFCNGYKAFVQLTEPDAEIYCIRCCKDKADCPVNKSTYGCKKVLGGVY
ncbi:hypothetical protein CPB97_001132 [Podila verticillata]|nr:hypothetical protein CPB97_001132 [Podila verticillata]